MASLFEQALQLWQRKRVGECWVTGPSIGPKKSPCQHPSIVDYQHSVERAPIGKPRVGAIMTRRSKSINHEDPRLASAQSADSLHEDLGMRKSACRGCKQARRSRASGPKTPLHACEWTLPVRKRVPPLASLSKQRTAKEPGNARRRRNSAPTS